MIVQDVINRVRRTVGDVDVLQFADADVYVWINDSAKECAQDNNLLQKTATTVVVNGTSDYNLPADILKLHSVRYDDQKINVLTMEEFDKYVSDFQTTSKGTSTICYIWAAKLTLYPIPDNSTKNLKILYTRTPVEVTANGDAIDLPVMYHRRIVDYCLAMVAEQDDDMERYQIKMQEFKSGVQNLKDTDEWQQDLYPFITTSVRDSGVDVEWDLYE